MEFEKLKKSWREINKTYVIYLFPKKIEIKIEVYFRLHLQSQQATTQHQNEY